MHEWIGYGPSACTQYQAARRKNIANLESWAEGMKSGNQPTYMEEETLKPEEFAHDAILFGLRMNQGISIPTIVQQFNLSQDLFSEIVKFLDRLVGEGLARVKDHGNYRLTGQGRILCDAIACDLPELSY